jgi:glycopeptide antibiotics resistance protein
MLKLSSRRLQIYWWLLAGTIVLLSLLPHPAIPSTPLGAYLNSYWAHFLVYLAVSVLPVLAWPRKTGLMISLGVAVISVGLEILRGLFIYRSFHVEDIIVNLFGVAAGILLGWNILTLRSRMSQVDGSGASSSHSDLL